MVPLAQAALAAPISHLAIFMPRRVIYDKLWASVSLSLGRNMTVPFLKRSFFSEYLVEKMKAGYRGRFRTYVAVNNYEDHSLFFFGAILSRALFERAVGTLCTSQVDY